MVKFVKNHSPGNFEINSHKIIYRKKMGKVGIKTKKLIHQFTLHVFFLQAIEILKTGWGMLMEKACSSSQNMLTSQLVKSPKKQWECFLTIWHCILSAELTTLSDCFFFAILPTEIMLINFFNCGYEPEYASIKCHA